MATRLQIRQGTNTENNNFTGASGELTFDTTNKEIRIHDGTTQGGITIANKQLLDTKLDKNISLNYSHITNCITEIPQDIKLELADGVLTLKAGSKVYVPNGTGVFDTIDIKSDLLFTYNSNRQGFLYYYNGGLGFSDSLHNCVSGNTDTKAGQEWHVWYDTANNVIKRYTSDATTPAYTGMSLPLAIITVSDGNISSIDQVFNGFGYIGSTVFALPGVKGLVPNGRNEDGTLNNTQIITDKVLTATDTIPYWMILRWGGNLMLHAVKYTTPHTNSSWWFDDEANIFYTTGGSGTIHNEALLFACVEGSSSTGITSFQPKTAFHAVDYNDSNYISQQGMPSSKYVNIPADKLGTTGTAHTAPGNGYFVIRTVANIADCTLTFQSAQEPYYGNSLFIPQGNDGRLFIPVKKDDQVMLYYTNLGTGTGDQATVFNFVYSQGQ